MGKYDLKELSRHQWTTDKTDFEAVRTSALIRIADAVEMCAQNHVALQRDRDFYQRLSKERAAEIEQLKHSRAAYKAHLTRLRRAKDQSDVPPGQPESEQEPEVS